MILLNIEDQNLSSYSYYLKYKSLINLIMHGNYLQADKYEKQLEKMYDFSKSKDAENLVDNLVWLTGDVLSLLVDIGKNGLGNIIGDWNQKTADFIGYDSIT